MSKYWYPKPSTPIGCPSIGTRNHRDGKIDLFLVWDHWRNSQSKSIVHIDGAICWNFGNGCGILNDIDIRIGTAERCCDVSSILHTYVIKGNTKVDGFTSFGDIIITVIDDYTGSDYIRTLVGNHLQVCY